MPLKPARLDADRTATARSRIVTHARPGDRIGPGAPLRDPQYEDETGARVDPAAEAKPGTAEAEMVHLRRVAAAVAAVKSAAKTRCTCGPGTDEAGRTCRRCDVWCAMADALSGLAAFDAQQEAAPPCACAETSTRIAPSVMPEAARRAAERPMPRPCTVCGTKDHDGHPTWCHMSRPSLAALTAAADERARQRQPATWSPSESVADEVEVAAPPRPKAPGPRRRAREMVGLTISDGCDPRIERRPPCRVCESLASANRVMAAEDCILLTRRRLAREFRKVRRAALKRAAREIRAKAAGMTLGCRPRVACEEDAAHVEAMGRKAKGAKP